MVDTCLGQGSIGYSVVISFVYIVKMLLTHIQPFNPTAKLINVAIVTDGTNTDGYRWSHEAHYGFRIENSSRSKFKTKN